MDATLFFVAQLMCCEVFFNLNHEFTATLLDKVASPQMCDLSNLGVLPRHKATRCNSYCKHGLVKQAALEAGDVAVNCQWTTPTGDVQSSLHLSRRGKKSQKSNILVTNYAARRSCSISSAHIQTSLQQFTNISPPCSVAAATAFPGVTFCSNATRTFYSLSNVGKWTLALGANYIRQNDPISTEILEILGLYTG